MEEHNIKGPRIITIGDVKFNLKDYEKVHNDFCEINRKLKVMKISV